MLGPGELGKDTGKGGMTDEDNALEVTDLRGSDSRLCRNELDQQGREGREAGVAARGWGGGGEGEGKGSADSRRKGRQTLHMGHGLAPCSKNQYFSLTKCLEIGVDLICRQYYF